MSSWMKGQKERELIEVSNVNEKSCLYSSFSGQVTAAIEHRTERYENYSKKPSKEKNIKRRLMDQSIHFEEGSREEYP